MAGQGGPAGGRSCVTTRPYAGVELASIARADSGHSLLPKRIVARRSGAGARHSAWHGENERPSGTREAEANACRMGAELITMNEMEQEDWLDRRLREAAPYID